MTRAAPRIGTIEASRAIAATLVVGFHIYKGYFQSARYWPGDVFGGVFAMGHAGVELFFVISGLIMVKLHWGDMGRPGMTGAFCAKRFARIYPLYWLCLAATSAAMLIVPGQANGRGATMGAQLGSWFLVGGDPAQSVMLVAWTLFHEMLFYALVGVVIWRPRIGVPVMLMWIGGSALLGAAGIDAGYGLAFINILFGLGIVTGLALRRRSLPVPAVLAAAGVLVLLATGADDIVWNGWSRPAQIVGYGAGSALALAGFIEMERRGWFACPRALMLVGAASYSIYLTHILVLALVTRLMAIFGLTAVVPGPVAFMGLMVIAVGAGVMVHLTAERRIVDFVRRRLELGLPTRASRQRVLPGR